MRIRELFLPSLISPPLCSDTLKQPGCIITCKKLHKIFISDRKLKQMTDMQHLSLMNFAVSPRATNEFSEIFPIANKLNIGLNIFYNFPEKSPTA